LKFHYQITAEYPTLRKHEWLINLNMVKHNVTDQEFKKEEKRQLVADGNFLFFMSTTIIGSRLKCSG